MKTVTFHNRNRKSLLTLLMLIMLMPATMSMSAAEKWEYKNTKFSGGGRNQEEPLPHQQRTGLGKSYVSNMV